MRNLKSGWILFCIGITPFLLNGFVTPAIYQNFVLYWLFDLTIWILIPVTVFTALDRHANLHLHEFGLNSRIAKIESVTAVALLSILIIPVLYVVYFLPFTLFSSDLISTPRFSYQQVLPESQLARVLVAGYFGVTAGLVEELLFKGLLFRLIKDLKAAHLIFVFTSSILFAAAHWESGATNLYAAFVYGFVTSLIYLGLKNLWPLVVGHAILDFIIYV